MHDALQNANIQHFQDPSSKFQAQNSKLAVGSLQLAKGKTQSEIRLANDQADRKCNLSNMAEIGNLKESDTLS